MNMLSDMSEPLSLLRDRFSQLARWSECSIEAVSGGFSGAGVFRVEDAEICYCLRRWPAGQTSAVRVLAIHQLLAFARDRGVAVVPVPFRSDSGTTLVEANGQLWQLEPWMPGESVQKTEPDDDRLSDARLQSAMIQLARFHNAIRDWSPTAEVRQWFQPASVRSSPTLGQRLRMIDSYAGLIDGFEASLQKEADVRFRDVGGRIVTLFHDANSAVRRELQVVKELSVLLQPCIRDLWHDHLLFLGNDLSGIVDFGAMATDSVCCDLSRLLGSLFGDDFASWQRALGYYESIRPMSEAEHRLLRPLDRSNVLLSGMTWLKRRYVLRNTPDDLSRVCDRLDSIVARLATLALDT